MYLACGLTISLNACFQDQITQILAITNLKLFIDLKRFRGGRPT